jgi:hypothetical protein
MLVENIGKKIRDYTTINGQQDRLGHACYSSKSQKTTARYDSTDISFRKEGAHPKVFDPDERIPGIRSEMDVS